MNCRKFRRCDLYNLHFCKWAVFFQSCIYVRPSVSFLKKAAALITQIELQAALLAGRFSYGDCFVIMPGCLYVVTFIKITAAVALPAFISQVITRGSNGFQISVIVFVFFGKYNNSSAAVIVLFVLQQPHIRYTVFRHCFALILIWDFIVHGIISGVGVVRSRSEIAFACTRSVANTCMYAAVRQVADGYGVGFIIRISVVWRNNRFCGYILACGISAVAARFGNEKTVVANLTVNRFGKVVLLSFLGGPCFRTLAKLTISSCL